MKMLMNHEHHKKKVRIFLGHQSPTFTCCVDTVAVVTFAIPFFLHIYCLKIPFI
jgi:hypothetical protein